MLSPIPDAYFSNLYHLSLAVLLSILLIAVFKFKDTRFSNRIMVINVFMLALLCYGTYHYSFRDENYRTELTLQHQAENMEWESMLNTVRKVKSRHRASLLTDTLHCSTPIRWTTFSIFLADTTP